MVKLRVPSNTDPSKFYNNEITPTSQSCDCMGFIMRHNCSHLRRSLEYIATNHIPLDFSEVITLTRLPPRPKVVKPKTRAEILKEEKLQHLREMYGY